MESKIIDLDSNNVERKIEIIKKAIADELSKGAEDAYHVVREMIEWQIALDVNSEIIGGSLDKAGAVKYKTPIC